MGYDYTNFELAGSQSFFLYHIAPKRLKSWTSILCGDIRQVTREDDDTRGEVEDDTHRSEKLEHPHDVLTPVKDFEAHGGLRG